MQDTPDASTPGRKFWLIAVVALIWNLGGVATYLMSVTMSAESLAAMTEAERSLYADIPAWVTSAYAVAVFGGTLGSLGLLIRKAWAVPLLILSLLGILVQMSHALFMTRLLAVRGGGAAILPVIITAVAVFLVWFSKSARSKGWIR
jgi:hypothetical protein